MMVGPMITLQTDTSHISRSDVSLSSLEDLSWRTFGAGTSTLHTLLTRRPPDTEYVCRQGIKSQKMKFNYD
jgi:hypothetical protein